MPGALSTRGLALRHGGAPARVAALGVIAAISSFLVVVVDGLRLGARVNVSRHAAATASKGPTLDTSIVWPLFSTIKHVTPGLCGSVFEAIVTLSPHDAAKIAASWPSYFQDERPRSGRLVAKELAKQAPYTGWMQHQDSTEAQQGSFPIMHGHELVRVGQNREVATFEKAGFLAYLESIAGPVEFAFHAGVDLRNCWGDLVDPEDRGVCSDEIFTPFSEDTKGLKPTYDSTGQSGSTVVTNLDGLVIKNCKDADEYEMMLDVMPTFSASLRSRHQMPGGGCYSTALAPICAAIVAPGAENGTVVQWLAMRKVELKGASPLNVALNVKDRSHLDLKGPTFAGMRDGKALLFGGWKGKDKGFTTVFPNGLQLSQCGSREAAYTLELDAELLQNLQMSDYSLLGSFYQVSSNASRCLCNETMHPRFPLILRGWDRDKGELQMAVGVIDYIERTVKTGLMSVMSTMLEPVTYKNHWMEMWPSYFRIQPHHPSPEYSVGQRVKALMKLRWRALSSEDKRALRKSSSMKKVNFGQLMPDSSLLECGYKYKVVAGSRGKIINISQLAGLPTAPIVRWDKYRNLYFRVEPEQITSLPWEG